MERRKRKEIEGNETCLKNKELLGTSGIVDGKVFFGKEEGEMEDEKINNRCKE